MDTQPAAQVVAGPRPQVLGSARVLAPVVCLALVVLYAVAAPARFRQVRDLSDLPSGIDPTAVRAELTAAGMSAEVYAGSLMAMEILFAVVCVAVAALLLTRRSADRMVAFTAVVLVLLGTTFWNTMAALASYHPGWGTLGEGLAAAAKLSLFGFLYVFPDGRFVPRWTRPVTALLLVGLAVEVVFADRPWVVGNWPAPAFLAFLLVLLASGVVAQAHRYRRISTPAQRQQTKWVVSGVVAAVTVFVVVVLVAEVALGAADPGSRGELVATALVTLGMMLVPLSIGVAMLRHRLFDVDLVINRALVYAVVTVAVVVGYVAVVGYIGALVRSQGDLVVSLVATGLVAVAFAPLRERVQRGVNRLM